LEGLKDLEDLEDLEDLDPKMYEYFFSKSVWNFMLKL
jgi:hypothetical protein